MKEILLQPMYVLPSQKRVKELVITKDMVERKAPALEVVREIEESGLS